MFFPQPNFTQSSFSSGGMMLDLGGLVAWGRDIANAGTQITSHIAQLQKEVDDIKGFLAFSVTQDPDIIRKYQDYKAVAAKTGDV